MSKTSSLCLNYTIHQSGINCQIDSPNFLDIASQSRPGRDGAGEKNDESENTNEQAEERREIEDRMYKEI